LRLAAARPHSVAMTRLADRLTPCGPVIDGKAAERTREILTEKLDGAPTLEAAWPALAPVFGASPYLSGLARRRPKALLQTLDSDPAERLAGILADAEAVGAESDSDEGRKRPRQPQCLRQHLRTFGVAAVNYD